MELYKMDHQKCLRKVLSARTCLFIIFVVLFTSIHLESTSQTTVIKGTAVDMPDKLVRLIVYNDQFSQLEKTIASTYTDQEGNFRMEIELIETTFAFLALELKKSEFYLKPGSTYEFLIPADKESKRGSVFDELPLLFTFKSDDGGLNEQIGEFNKTYNEFIINNTNRIYRSRDKSLVAEFSNAVTEKYSSSGDKYLLHYINYTIASLEWVSKIKSEEEIIQTYFNTELPILYQNIQYTSFFIDFFKAMFGATHLFSYDDFIDAINSERGYIHLDRLLQKSEQLASNPEVRELVAMILLAKKYHSPDIRKYKVLNMLKELQRNSRYTGVELVAANYLKKLPYLGYGSPAPIFNLSDSTGAKTSLSHYEGKFVLLNFNKSDCPLCLHYMQDLEDIKKEYKGALQIILIVNQDGFDEMLEYAQQRSYEWPILNIGKDILILEDYNIRAYPAYIIINPDNTIATANAPLPQEGLGFYIKRYINQFTQIREGNRGE